MAGSQIALVIMTGPTSESEPERMVAQAREAITLDTVDKALALPVFAPIVAVTDSASLAERLRGKAVRVELGEATTEFHFGRKLRDVINEHAIERVLYVGGGSAALLSAEGMARIAESLLSRDRHVVANNFYSTDFAAFAPARAIESIDLPDVDNDLAWRLVEQAGLTCTELPRDAASQLDVDTPSDLMTLKSHPGAGPHTRSYLDGLDLDTTHVEQALRYFTDRDAEVTVAGRVSASTWAYLEQETACRVRVFAEERGMRASGRQAQGKARSILGFLLQAVGLERLFTALAEMSQAVFLDSRVLLAHMGIWPSASDRFYSDLRRPETIGDVWLREFTQAAMEAPIPVVLGGHSLVSGGLYALVESAWSRSDDLARHVAPSRR